MVTGEQEVKDLWEKHFTKLHNGSSGAFDEQHNTRICEELPHLERIPADSEDILNVDISYIEVRNSVFKAKINKRTIFLMLCIIQVLIKHRF